MEGVKNRWLEALRQQVEEISDKFSNFFKEMGCAGQVKLQEQGSVSACFALWKEHVLRFVVAFLSPVL